MLAFLCLKLPIFSILVLQQYFFASSIIHLLKHCCIQGIIFYVDVLIKAMLLLLCDLVKVFFSFIFHQAMLILMKTNQLSIVYTKSMVVHMEYVGYVCHLCHMKSASEKSKESEKVIQDCQTGWKEKFFYIFIMWGILEAIWQTLNKFLMNRQT